MKGMVLMTILVIGGAFQGKRQYAKETFGLSDSDIFEPLQKEATDIYQFRCINHLHLIVRKMIQIGKCSSDIMEELQSAVIGKIILCDDISCGIVPMHPFERNYRETVGRLLCELARRADVVIRMQCGIAQLVKGEVSK